MKKLFLLLFIITAFLRAEINECVTDIYFGNGVWNDYKAASKGRKALQWTILDNIYHGDLEKFKQHHYSDRSDPKLNKNIVILSFNWTGSSPNDSLSFESKVIDVIETFYQLKDNNQLEGYSLYDILKVWLTQDPTSPLSNTLWDKIDDIVTDYSRAIEGTNLVKMIEDYERISLRESHKVLLVAHSQGNLFGNEVYDNLISWEKDYFQMVSVGTPASSVLGKSTPYTTLKCDKVIHNNIIGGIPGHLPAETNCTGEEQSGDGHQFTASYLSNHLSLEEIVTNISERIDFLKGTSSQWIIDQEFEKDTCNHKITLKHLYDPSIEMAEKVYPFNASQKLYQVNGEWVKASCGGKNILSEWDGKKENECWMVDNPQKEKILSQLEIIGKFYIQYSYNYLSEWFSHSSYTNEEFKVLTDCDGYGSGYYGSPESIDAILNFTPEQNRFYFVDYNYHTRALGCELDKLNKSWEDIDVIKKGFVRREYSDGKDHAYVEYLVDFK